MNLVIACKGIMPYYFSMPDKKFLSLDEQIAHLENDKKIQCDKNSKESLLRIGYFNLVNGYKTPFTSSKDNNGNHIYAKGTTINELISLKTFDDDLRYLLLKYLTKAEEEIKTISSYLLEKTKKKSVSWKSPKAYNLGADQSEIQKLISRIQKQLHEREDLDYIKFYRDQHDGKFPMWVITKAIYFGTFIDLVELSKEEVSDSLCEIYCLKNSINEYDKKLLIGSLHWIRIFRNACAHNERIYCLHGVGRIFENEIKKLGKRYKKIKERKLFDLLVYLRYYMQKEEYQSLISKIKKSLEKLESSISQYAFDNIRGGTGIKSLDDLDILSNDGFDNNYQILY